MSASPTAELAAQLHRGATRVRRRRAVVLTALALTGLAGVVLELFLGGSARLDPVEVWHGVLGTGDGLTDYVVRQTRLPRALVAVLAGGLFGVAGALYQRLVGNPLATPDVIGVSAGAAAGAVVVMTFFATRGVGVQFGALIGALLAAALIWHLAWRNGLSTARLVLVGIALAACCTALTSYLITRADEATTERAMRWMIGSLNGSDWPGVGVLALTAVGTAIVMLWCRPGMSTLPLGDALARALGTRVEPLRLGLLVTGAVLAALATSVIGPVAFVALVAGPIAVRLLRTDTSIGGAALTGAALLVVADVLAQSAPFISPVPTGTLTAALGAPALVVLLLKGRTR